MESKAILSAVYQKGVKSMKYIYTGTIKDLRKHGFVVHFQKESRYTYANRNYKTDYLNSIYIFLGDYPAYFDQKNIIVFNNEGNKGDIREYIDDLIADGLVRIEEKENIQ